VVLYSRIRRTFSSHVVTLVTFVGAKCRLLVEWSLQQLGFRHVSALRSSRSYRDFSRSATIRHVSGHGCYEPSVVEGTVSNGQEGDSRERLLR
jgi:hypothetical protein